MAKKMKVMTKSALYAHLAEETGLKKADVSKLLEVLAETAKAQLGPKGAGVFTLPGIARLKVRKVKAVKGGVEKINPLNKQKYITKDKPAFNKVTSRPIKAFSEALK
jgi:nucleoid DNA-binding protein